MSIDNQPQIGGFPARTASSSVPSRPAVATLPPPDPRAAVSIRGLYKRFDRKIAVNGLSLDIPVGSFIGLVGPNGAGKTTTLNMVTGLLVPDAGTAMILGQDVWQDVNAAKREIGVMPQPDQIFDRLTGMQLLIYSGMLRGMKRDVAHSRAGDLLNAFDLVSAADTMVSDYSAGMTKKICLASAMIHSPRILVLDEPFGVQREPQGHPRRVRVHRRHGHHLLARDVAGGEDVHARRRHQRRAGPRGGHDRAGVGRRGP